MRPDKEYRPEQGATLVLALVFVVAIGLLLLAIVSLTGTNLADTANLQNERALEYTADGAVDAAVQAARYCPVPNQQTPVLTCAQPPVTPCSPTAGYAVSKGGGPINGANADVVVYCQVAAPQYERQVTFTACPPSDSSLNACQAAHNGTTDEILVAQVLYTDLAAGCLGGGCTTVIGQSVSVLSWNVKRANG